MLLTESLYTLILSICPFTIVYGKYPASPLAKHRPIVSNLGSQRFYGLLKNFLAKYVASRSLRKLAWFNSILLQGDIVGEIKKLKAENSPELQVHGSGNFIQTLLKHDLVDELWLKIFPITLGTGKRLFAEGTMPKGFTLRESKISPKGIIFANYERAGEVKTGSF